MKISTRFQNLPNREGDPWKIYLRAKELEAAGEPVINLSVGDHDAPTPQFILDEAARSARMGNTGYAALTGTGALRAAIAERATVSTGAPVSTDEIAVVPGGQFALFTALSAVLNPGDGALLIEPYYATYPITVRAALGAPVLVPSLPDRGFQPDLEALDAAAPSATALVLNSPNNPTGAIYSRDTLEGIAEIALRRDLWVISDEVYDSQVWEGTHLSIRSLPGMAERVMVVGSLSKSHRMTGSRLGWLIAPKPVMSLCWEFLVSTTYGVPGFLQDAALRALNQGAETERDVFDTYKRRRDLAVRAFEGTNRVKLAPPQGAMYVMLDIRQTGLSGDDFAERLLDQHRIAVMPGEGFGSAGAGHVRVALTVEDTALSSAFESIRAFADVI
ncbi:MAG: pyridoxal phosphate-dependent aminotransferase [Pseudomonadota bacterium]